MKLIHEKNYNDNSTWYQHLRSGILRSNHKNPKKTLFEQILKYFHYSKKFWTGNNKFVKHLEENVGFWEYPATYELIIYTLIGHCNTPTFLFNS